ncbi:MAG TPA: cyclic pyranopterin monophosphate synthase MoaC [Firmicutes bacterium]|nr:cyclic pyranopterin monophosphate synthase MoaC [Bacillota bacterium]
MVDVSEKPVTVREAVARARVTMKPETLALIEAGQGPKGEVLGVARVAAIMAVKRTGDLVPMCHPVSIRGIDVEFRTGGPAVPGESASIELEVTVKAEDKTGVEMEALTGAAVGALAIYDMCKSVDRGMVIQDIRLIHKSGGRSGEYRREGEAQWD